MTIPRRPSFFSSQVLAASLLMAATLGLPSSSAAQTQDSHPAVQRYNRTAKGANVEEWKKRMTDPEVRTRLDAIDSLGTKGGDEAIRPLIEATSDEDYRVRTRAIDFLGSLRALQATPVLLQLLFLADVGHAEKLRALTALGRIADPGTSDRLVAYAATISDNDLACRAVYAVGEIGNPASKAKVATLKGTRPGTDMDRLVDDAVLKITVIEQTPVAAQPTLLELEKKMARQQPPAQ